MSSENYEQVDDSNHFVHMLDGSSHKESDLNPQDCKDDASDPEGDDFSEEINDDDDYYESMLEDADNGVDYDEPNHDFYQSFPLFQGDYCCYPLSFINKGDLDVGNKIILPANDLAPILQNNIPMPLEFEIHNLSKGKVSHCGVYEFSGDEKGVAFLPDWMVENMQLKEGDFMHVKNTNLEKATYIKIQPHCSDFLEILNPKAVLEHNLQKFSCLTKGDTIEVVDGSKKFLINVVETKPDNAISVIDTDIEVDFAPPLDYKEPITQSASKEQVKEATEKLAEFKPFTGIARKLGEEPSSGLGSFVYKDSVNPAPKLGCLDNKKPSAAAAQSHSKNGQEKEATEKPELEPFTGIARKLGEEPRLDLGCLPNSATAALRRMEGAEEKAISNSKSRPQNKGKEVTDENVEAEKKPKFQPFTGKKYTLAG